MLRIIVLEIAVLSSLAWAWPNDAMAGFGSLKGRVAYRESQTYPWHGDYYDPAWGSPVAVVVPPTAETQTHLGSTVGATRITPIQHQFERGYPTSVYFDRPRFRHPPLWPSSTDQLGDYYIRGPW